MVNKQILVNFFNSQRQEGKSVDEILKQPLFSKADSSTREEALKELRVDKQITTKKKTYPTIKARVNQVVLNNLKSFENTNEFRMRFKRFNKNWRSEFIRQAVDSKLKYYLLKENEPYETESGHVSKDWRVENES